MISTRSVELVIDTVVCLTLAKWETVSGQFGGYLIMGITGCWQKRKYHHSPRVFKSKIFLARVNKDQRGRAGRSGVGDGRPIAARALRPGAASCGPGPYTRATSAQ